MSYAVGIVNHASYDDLASCLETLKRQTQAPLAVYVVDTGVNPERLEQLARAHPDVAFERRPNRGWGAGVNRLLARIAAERADAEHVLILNPDVQLDASFSAVLLAALAERPRVAIASGKLLRPGRSVIDSAGIRLPRHRRPRDRGSEEPDRGHYDSAELVFGVSGAAMWLRRAALADLALDGEIVDESFFAYHDDTDLCWRAQRLGWQVLYEPRAIAVHGRRWQRGRRMEIEASVRRHSFKNHYLQILKNERGVDALANLPWLLAWEMLRLGYAVIRDRAILPGYLDAWRAAPGALARRRMIRQRATRNAAAPPRP